MKKLCAIFALLALTAAIFFGCSAKEPLGEFYPLNSSDASGDCNSEDSEMSCISSSSDFDNPDPGDGNSSSVPYDYSSAYNPSSDSGNPNPSSGTDYATESSSSRASTASSSSARSSAAVSSPSVSSSSAVSVSTGSANTCAYQPTLCGGIAFDDIITTSFNNVASLDDGPNCIFATGITKLGNENGQGGGLRVNGTKLTGNNSSDVGGRCGNTDWGQQSCADAIRNVSKIDGGYYIYAPGWVGDITTTGGNPSCAGSRPSSNSGQQSSSSRLSSSSAPPGTATLTCGTVPSTGTAGQSIATPTVNCNGNVVTGSNIAWSGTPSAPNWTNPNAGTYSSIKAKVNAGATGTAQACRDMEANCSGTLTVSQPPPPSSSSQGGSGGTCETCVASGQLTKSAPTTRYWDACKPSCSWPGKQTNGQGTAKSCNISGGSIDANTGSACSGGSSYTCMNQAPWSVSASLSYGFAAAHSDADCGKCFQLEFSGKTLVVMISNIGNIQAGAAFDLMIPGGGTGDFDALTRQVQQSGVNNPQLGNTWGGFRQTCGNDKSCVKRMCDAAFANLPDLKSGCNWYVDWMDIADNPTVRYEQITCPAALKNKW